MAFGLATPVRNAIVDSAAARFDAGVGAATIEVRTGTKPANPQAAATGTLLVTFTLNDPSWDAAVAGSATLDVTPGISAVGVATDTAGWFRVKDSTGATVGDGTCGTVNADMIMSSTSVATGQVVNLTAGTMTEPETP